jgi:hypothetical protein
MPEIIFGPAGGIRPYKAFYWNVDQHFQARAAQQRDNQFMAFMIATIKMTCPVRSGKTMDTMLQGLSIQRISGVRKGAQAGSGFILEFMTAYPPDRPRFISGRVKHSGEIGYGEVYFPEEPEVPRQMLELSKTGKTARYMMNDPTAEGNILHKVEQEIQLHVINEIQILVKTMPPRSALRGVVIW